MIKNTVRVVKRKDRSEIAEVVGTANPTANPEQEMANLVNGWIRERSANDRTEKAFSKSKILSWKASRA